MSATGIELEILCHLLVLRFLLSAAGPLLSTTQNHRGRLIAPLSTVLLAPKDWISNGLSSAGGDKSIGDSFDKSNIPPGYNWTDLVPAGTIVLAQQPTKHISAIFGDIMLTRLVQRGIVAAVADGKVRDASACRDLQDDAGGRFQVWSTGISAVGPSLEARPWRVNTSLTIGDSHIEPGDIMCLDQQDEAIVVIPQNRLLEVYQLLPILKKASDGVLKSVREGATLPDAIKQHLDFYSNYSS